MKDKLVRNHHKAGYYMMKKICVGASIVVASSVLIALPLSFGLNMVKSSEIAKAEESKTVTNIDYLHF
ncbi:MAG: hypothetical protein WCS51_00265 [Bacilli bacterium]|jgi:hypothetical protein